LNNNDQSKLCANKISVLLNRNQMKSGQQKGHFLKALQEIVSDHRW